MAIETILMNPGKEAEALASVMGRADAVLIDAPCSGRAPGGATPRRAGGFPRRNWPA
jgi:16S rRNA C967 or C1407 C5-methylase (RsmB/RsmF family)